MKKLKIIPAVLGLCLTLNITGTAIKPSLEEKMRETILIHSLSIKKDVPTVLDTFRIYLSDNQDTDQDLVKTVTKYLTYYMYTLYPRGISMGERIQLISFFEQNLAKCGLPSEFKNEFFRALESAPVEPNKFFLGVGNVQSCDNAIQILARNPYLTIGFVIDLFKQKFDNSKDTNYLYELTKAFTYFVYSLYSRPLPDKEKAMLGDMYKTFNSSAAPSASVKELEEAIIHIPT